MNRKYRKTIIAGNWKMHKTATEAKAFAERLKERTGLPLPLWDERRTTVDAHRILGAQGVRAKNRKD